MEFIKAVTKNIYLLPILPTNYNALYLLIIETPIPVKLEKII